MKEYWIKWCDRFSRGIGVILLLAACLKFAALFSQSHEMGKPDPVIGISHNRVAVIAFVLELSAGVYLITSKVHIRKLWTIVGVANCLAAYRLGLVLSGANVSCGCLGVASQLLPFIGKHESALSLLVIISMMLGSWGLLFVRMHLDSNGQQQS